MSPASKKTPQPPNKPKSNLGLGEIGNLASLLQQPAEEGKPLEIDIDLIDEDVNNARRVGNKGLSKESIEEIATTIAEHGVKSPVSLRTHPTVPGRYMLNYGARRLRGSKLAGKKTIPAFIDEESTDSDRFIENVQRVDLSTKEIALHVKQKLDEGLKQSDIARLAGKSKAFISQHVALLDLPPALDEAFQSERLKDVTLINDLLREHRKNPEAVELLLADPEREIGRAEIKALREPPPSQTAPTPIPDTSTPTPAPSVAPKTKGPDDSAPQDKSSSGKNEVAAPGSDKETVDATARPLPARKDEHPVTKVEVVHGGRAATLVMDTRAKKGWALVKYHDNGSEAEVNLAKEQVVLSAVF